MKKLILASALLATSGLANADVVNMGNGVSVDTAVLGDLNAAGGNFNNSFNFIQWWDNSATAGTMADSLSDLTLANASTYTLNGIGKIEIPGAASNVGKLFCTSCELTLEFGGLGLEFANVMNPSAENAYAALNGFPPADVATLQAWLTLMGSPLSAEVPAPNLTLDNGYLNVYVDASPEADFVNDSNDAQNTDAARVAKYTDGELFLGLRFEQTAFNPLNILDGVFGLSNADAFFGLELNDDPLTAGSAAVYLEEDIIRETVSGLTEFVDIVGLGMSAAFATNNTGDYNLFASGARAGTFSGVAVPEPATVAIFGLGLLGLAGAARRKKA